MIINLTQHEGTQEQGIREPENKKQVQDLLTFNQIPTVEEIGDRARLLAAIAKESDVEWAMIGGAPYLMSALEKALRAVGIIPLYAFSVRECVEEMLPDGSVKKKMVFRHLGWVRV